MQNLKKIIGYIMIGTLVVGAVSQAFGEQKYVPRTRRSAKSELQVAIETGNIKQVKEFFDDAKNKNFINKQVGGTGLTPLQLASHAYDNAKYKINATVDASGKTITQNLIEIMKYLKDKGAKVTDDIENAEGIKAAKLKKSSWLSW